MEVVHAVMDSCGSRWPRETVAKTMLRMTRPARSPTCRSNRPLDAMGSATTTYDTLWHTLARWETTLMHWTKTLP